MKKILSIIMAAFMIATLAGCKKETKVADQEKGNQKQEEKTTDSKKPGKINGIDVDAILKDTFPNDPNYEYKEKITKDFITNGEDIKQILEDKYKLTGRGERNFTKTGKISQMDYDFYKKDYKENLNSDSYGLALHFNDEKKYKIIEVRSELVENPSEQNAKLDDVTKNILKKFADNIPFDEVEKRINKCIALAKDKKMEFVDGLKTGDTSAMKFSQHFNKEKQVVTVTLRFQNEEYGYK